MGFFPFESIYLQKCLDSYFPNFTIPLYCFFTFSISSIASLYFDFMSSLTVKFMIVPQLGHTEMGCFNMKARSSPRGVLQPGQGKAILF